MEIRVAHNLPIEEVKNRLKNLEEVLRKDYGNYIKSATVEFLEDKVNFNANISGFNIKGLINILQDAVIVDLDIPLMLKGFSGTIKETIKEELSKLLR